MNSEHSGDEAGSSLAVTADAPHAPLWPIGPWWGNRCTSRVGGYRSVWEIDSPDACPVVTVEHTMDDFAEWEGAAVDNSEVDATAALIVSAPELFDVLAALVHNAEDGAATATAVALLARIRSGHVPTA